MKYYIYLFLLGSQSLGATLLSDSFTGIVRPALQDAAPSLNGADPFQVLANPAWSLEGGRAALSFSSVSSTLSKKLNSEESSQILMATLQQRYQAWGLGVVAFLPTGTQPILDTGDESERSSPWTNMTRQFLYVANVSFSPENSSWSYGALLPLYFDAEADADTRLAAADVRSRVSVSLRPRLSYALGVSYKKNNWGTSLMYKERSQARAEAKIEGNIPALSLDLLFEGESFYSFDPRRLSWNLFYKLNQSVLGLRLRFSNWVEYSPPYVRVRRSSLLLNDSFPSGAATNNWDMAISYERSLNLLYSLASSVGYRQSPFKEMTSFYDADHYIVALGVKRKFASDWELSSYLRTHILDSDELYIWAGLGLGYRL